MPSDTPPSQPQPPEAPKAPETVERSPHVDYLKMLYALPPTPERDQVIRNHLVREYERNRQKTASIIATPERQAHVEGYMDVIDGLRDAGFDNGLVNERARAFRTIARLGKVDDPATSKFDIAGFAATVNDELLNLAQIRSALAFPEGEPRQLALAKAETYLGTMLDWYRLPHALELLEKFDLRGIPQPDETRKGLNKEIGTLGRLLVFTASVGMGIISGIMSWKKDGDPFSPVTLAYMGIAAGSAYWPQLMDSKAEQLKSAVAFIREPQFTGFAWSFSGPINRHVDALMEEGNRIRAQSAVAKLIAKPGKPHVEEERAAAREELIDMMAQTPADTPLAEAMLKDPQAFAGFIIPVLNAAKTDDVRQYVDFCLGKVKPPTPDQLAAALTPPPVS